jgi:hypothetical protein
MKEMMPEKLADAEREGAKMAVLEAALLFDAGWDDLTDEVWVTVVDAETAARRASERSGFPVEQVLERIQKAQMASDERIRRSDFVIDTSGTLEETRGAIEAWEELRERLSGAGSGLLSSRSRHLSSEGDGGMQDSSRVVDRECSPSRALPGGRGETGPPARNDGAGCGQRVSASVM